MIPQPRARRLKLILNMKILMAHMHKRTMLLNNNVEWYVTKRAVSPSCFSQITAVDISPLHSTKKKLREEKQNARLTTKLL